MDKDTIVSGGESWVNDVDLKQYGLGDGRKGFTRTVTYADGRKVLEIYEYGTDGVVDTRDVGVDMGVRAAWEKSERSANPNPASQSETVSAPPNQKYVIRDGPEGLKPYPNPNYVAPDSEAVKAGKKTEIVTGPGGNSDLVTWEIMPDGSKGRIIEQRPATKAEIEAAKGPQPSSASGKKRVPVEGFPGIFQVTVAKKDTADGSSSETSETYYEDEQGNRVAQPTKPEQPKLIDLPNGQKGSLIPDQSQPSGFRVEPIAGTEPPKPGQGPSLADLQTRYGRIVDDLKAYAVRLQEALAQGTITQADYDKRWDEAKAVANTKVNEINSLVSTQRALYSDQAANWRQEQATANTRLNASTQAMQMGMTAANSMKGLDPSGSVGAGQLWGTLTAGRAAGQMYGGYDSGPAPQMPAALQRIMSFDMLEDGTIQIRPKAGTGPVGDGAAPQIGPAALGAMDESIKSAINADVAAAGGGGTTLDMAQTAPAQIPNSLMAADSYGFMRDELGLDDSIIQEAMAGFA